MTAAILAAEFTNGSKRRPAKLDITSISNGQRTTIYTIEVEGKRYARALALRLGATPWNF